MKNCDIRKLQLYFDGELPENIARQLEAHICGCPICRRELSALRQLGRIIGDFPEFQPAPAVRLTAKSRTTDTCPRIIRQISDFLEGTLPERRREMLVLHFALCSNCREELAVQKQLRVLTAALPEQTPPEKIRLTVQEALRQRRRARLAPPSPWPRIRRVATAAALAVVAVALVWGFPNLSINSKPSETAAVAPDKNENPAPPEVAEKSPVEPMSMENPVAEVAPVQPKIPLVATPPTPRERVAFIPIRSRNLAYRHVSLPGRVVEISNPVEMAALPQPEREAYNAAPTPAAVDPTAIAAARQDLLRASEQYEVLQMEKSLSHLPSPEHLINTPINDNKKPMKEPDASKFESSRFA